jgi:uncharacterized membrane protein YvlD (DUF360 family)
MDKSLVATTLHTTPPQRGWFQIHLLTAVALMIVAGVLLGANLNDFEYFGWPFTFISLYAPSDATGAKIPNVSKEWGDISRSILAFDAIVAVVCMIMTAFIFEARTWGWSRGKIFVWAFIGSALSLQMLDHLFNLIAEATGIPKRP